MGADSTAELTFYVFDHIEAPINEYWQRLDRISGNLRGVVKVPQHPVTCLDDILALEKKYVDEGYEGVMLRAFQGPRSFYKYGRSTAKEATLLKLKRYTDFEARIVGIEEEMHNGNEATKDELGRTKRSSHAENKTGKSTMGRMLCEDLETGIDFKCGIFKGFDAKWKKKVWETPEIVVGQIGKFQKFGPGEKDRPRHPKFLGLRSSIDM
jgi:DNA ligase-1